MKTKILGCLAPLLLGCHFAGAQTNAPIPWDQIGTKAGADYKGGGLAVTPTASGARLHCVFQRLEGEATREGLWLTSTVPGQSQDRFRVTAAVVGRNPEGGRASPRALTLSGQAGNSGLAGTLALPARGTVSVERQTVRFSRPSLVEEYSVSMDGVRQDFVVLAKPALSLNHQPSTLNPTSLRVELAVMGATVEQTAGGAQLVLAQSGRKIAYSRLKVTDANGKELPARIEVASNSALHTSHSPIVIAILVDDSDAVYPVRIDPTFSDANWSSLGGINGADSTVSAAVVDGSGNLYIGGGFTVVGDVIANRIAKWNGSNWTALGSGMNDQVYALAVSGSDVYAGGYFTTAGGSTAKYIAKWNGSAWSAVGAGMNWTVYALAVSGSDVYAGGYFTTATNSGGLAVTVNRIAKWNGSSWSALGSGMNSNVCALAVSGSDVYAGGYFTTATNSGGLAVTVSRIAKWNGSSWSALGSGMNNSVYALAVSGSDVYAGGYFTTATNSGGLAVTVSQIAKWNGSSWSALGSGINGIVLALAVSGNDVYAGGYFTTAGGGVANYIANWNGSAWSALGSGMDNNVQALAVSGSDVYAGGFFKTAGDRAANYIAKWNVSAWSALGSGMGGSYPSVYALAVSGSDLYAGGGFTAAAGGSAANRIAKWNGSIWSALGSGMNSNVLALAVSGGNVYAGGIFTTAGGGAANYIAKWNGSAWSALGSGMNSNVQALAVSGSDLYAGGDFTTAGGGAANYIVKWNGSAWSALGPGMNDTVDALAVWGTNLYAGGWFTTAGGSTANGIAKWNGGAWSALGSGMNSGVLALAVSGSELYAGGQFTTVGDGAANFIAKWDGSAWSALGSGMNGWVWGLAAAGGDVCAGGDFTTAGGSPANRIARWNGTAWSALGSGMNAAVFALAVSGSDLYAGGGFTTTGGKVSARAAKAIAISGNWLRIARGVPGPDTNTLSFMGVPRQSYTIQFATNLGTPLWLSLVTTNTDSYGRGIVQDPDASAARRFYRVASP